MAEPAVVSVPVVVLAFGEWGRRVAAKLSAVERPPILALDGAACRPEVLFSERAYAPSLAVLVDPDADASAPFGPEALRSDLQDRGVTHLTVARDDDWVWVGPTVVPLHPGCDACWRARRRQHADALTHVPVARAAPVPGGAGPRVPVTVADPDLAARAALAVLRRTLADPDTEAGVVRRFEPSDGPPAMGRVVPVPRCPRCDASSAPRAEWSLRALAPTNLASTRMRREVNHGELPDNARPARRVGG
jgi:bacteriocin biosynthesis cyclodehydratase domain-containing protein